MTETQWTAALKALALSEADADDVRLVHDEDWGTLVVALHPTPKHGVHLLLVRLEGDAPPVRVRLAGRHIRALATVCAELLEDE